MKKTILTYGLASAASSITLAAIIFQILNSRRFGLEDLLGYTSMVLSALIIFFGIRSYRDNAEGGHISFGSGFKAGMMITLIAAVCYVAAVEVMVFGLMPGIPESFRVCMVERAHTEGASAQKVIETARTAQRYKDMYGQPATNALMSFAETVPVGLIASAISAAILRRKTAPPV